MAFLTAGLGPGQPQAVAKEACQGEVVFHRQFVFVSVYREMDCSGHFHLHLSVHDATGLMAADIFPFGPLVRTTRPRQLRSSFRGKSALWCTARLSFLSRS